LLRAKTIENHRNATLLSGAPAVSIDIKLLGFVAAALFFFMAIMLLLTQRQAGRVRGAQQWLWGTLVLAVGIALNTMQDSITPFLGFIVSNALIIVGPMMTARGSFEYRYHRVMPAYLWVAPAVCSVLLLAYFVYAQPNTLARVLIVAAVVTVTCAWHLWVLLAGSAVRPNAPDVQHVRFRLAHGIMVLGLLVMIAVLSLRGWDALKSLLNDTTQVVTPQTAFIFYVVGMAGRMLLLIGMILVLIDELDHALRSLASRDSLTGLLNRRGFMQAALESDVIESCLLMLDLDRFKAVNDAFGHDQGDRVIVLLARCAQETLPANTVIARLGGEEFCALLPRTNAQNAFDLAEALRAAFHQQSERLGHAKAHSVSIGVAANVTNATTALQEPRDVVLAKLMEHADTALYQAKREGRNRVERYSTVA
jgi:diguanylate cyclase (GGDEF)-like protein